MEKIDFQKVQSVFNEVKKQDICSNKGRNNPRVAERQFLYGDVCDFLRDYHNDLSLDERHLVAMMLIGDYVITNTLL